MRKNYDDINEICAMCEHSREIFDPENVLCEIHGVVDAAFNCRKFVYDPLKRVPSKSAKPNPLDYVDIDSDEE